MIMNPLQWLCLLLLFAGMATEITCATTFNVLEYGARRDGRTDSSKAFLAAWKKGCSRKSGARVLVPRGNYFVKPVSFEGPCKGKMEFQMEGFLKSPANLRSFPADYWIRFLRIDGFKLTGHGTFDGQGASAWPHNDCSRNTKCRTLPVTLRLDFITNGMVRDIKSLDSKRVHINVFACKHMELEHITIRAPEDSPNTDGIHIGSSNDITISHSTIGTGDDCVSLSPGSTDIHVSNVTCGPGHGISLGSLGGTPKEAPVTGVTVKNCTFVGTTNGLRIKTRAPSYPGFVSNITFQGIRMENVLNPIFIDQQYCPFRYCKNQRSQVRVRDVTYDGIWGTSASKVAVNFDCSRSVPCRNIKLRDIHLVHTGKEPASASCVSVTGISEGKQFPPSCLSR